MGLERASNWVGRRYIYSWSAGTIERCIGNVMYDIRLGDGRVWTRHVDHVRRQTKAQFHALGNSFSPTPQSSPLSPVLDNNSREAQPFNEHEPVDVVANQAAPLPRRSSRVTAGIPPVRYGLN